MLRSGRADGPDDSDHIIDHQLGVHALSRRRRLVERGVAAEVVPPCGLELRGDV
jgi:hypothetical protein